MKVGTNVRRRALFYGALLIALVGAGLYCSSMPGRSFRGNPPALDERESHYESLVRRHVAVLAGVIGERSTEHPRKLHAAADYIEAELRGEGYDVRRHPYIVDGVTSDTLDAELAGTESRDIVLVGAHYDSAAGAPGADDNATGTAAVLALANALAGRSWPRAVRFVLFPDEEPPYFGHETMGSAVYARESQARGDSIVAMVCLESIGYFTYEAGTQHYPGAVSLLYPDRGDFVGFVGDTGSRALIRDSIGVFRGTARIASEGAALPAWVPGVDWSDHRSFRAAGIPAFMITDTAIFRNPNYHKATDTPETLDYAALARVVAGVHDVLVHLAARPETAW